MREDVSLQMVDLDHRDVARNRESLGERDTDEQRSEQTRTSREGDGVNLVGGDSGLLQGDDSCAIVFYVCG